MECANPLMTHWIQTLLMTLLLAIAIATAFFDARELLFFWYSKTVENNSWGYWLGLIQLILCIALAGVISARLYYHT